MRVAVAGMLLLGLCTPVYCQNAPARNAPSLKDRVNEHVQVQSFELRRREDNYGIASFVIANDSDRTVNSLELFCWLNDDRARGTKVLVWPSPHPIPAHQLQRFSNVNIGLVGDNPRGQCEVSAVE